VDLERKKKKKKKIGNIKEKGEELAAPGLNLPCHGPLPAFVARGPAPFTRSRRQAGPGERGARTIGHHMLLSGPGVSVCVRGARGDLTRGARAPAALPARRPAR
jgi:hypothetical protein